MRDLSPGWATDLYILERSGSVIEDRRDHLVVRTPDNPHFHWGNCLFVTADGSVDDAQKWVTNFHEAFPTANWIAIGLVRMPTDEAAWADQGASLELEQVLTTRGVPRLLPLPEGYVVRELRGEDWEQSVARVLRENERSREYELLSHERFTRARVAALRDLTDQGIAAFFGAFADGQLVAELGIVRCETTARYQSVGTDAAHQRRGLASHLLGVAAQWSVDQGCEQWVIVTESTNPAGRVYRSVGFEPDTGSAQAYRRAPR